MTPNHQYRPSIASALILSPDPLGGALVAAAVELAGVRAVFAQVDEGARTALRRLRPSHALIAADDPCMLDEAFMGPAKMTGVSLVVFGSAKQLRAMESVVRRYGLAVLSLPEDLPTLPQLLTTGLESSRHRPESTAR